MTSQLIRTPLEEAFVRDEARALELARETPAEALLPLLAKYAKPIHPFGTRERVLACLAERQEAAAVEIIVSFLDTAPENDTLRAQAAALLAERDCSAVADRVVAVVSAAVAQLVEIAPALVGVARTDGPRWAAALQGLEQDLQKLLDMATEAIAEAAPKKP